MASIVIVVVCVPSVRLRTGVRASCHGGVVHQAYSNVVSSDDEPITGPWLRHCMWVTELGRRPRSYRVFPRALSSVVDNPATSHISHAALDKSLRFTDVTLSIDTYEQLPRTWVYRFIALGHVVERVKQTSVGDRSVPVHHQSSSGTNNYILYAASFTLRYTNLVRTQGRGFGFASSGRGPSDTPDP